MKMTYTENSTKGLKTGIFLLLFLMGCNALAQKGSATVRNELSEIEKQNLLSLVNEARSKGSKCGDRRMPPAAAVAWDDRLESAANRHSLDMSARNFLSHTGSDGSTLSERITAAGFIWNSCGENIALGYKTEQQVVEGWLKSPAHCMNIMNQDFRFMGVARSGTYWTQDFGGRQQGP